MKDRTAVLVTGSRDLRDWRPIHERLACYPAGTILLHGDCGRYEESPDPAITTPVIVGADRLAGRFGRSHGFNVWSLPYFSDLGKRGGPARNSCMLNILAQLSGSGFTCAVEAFPIGESRGTRGCIKMAEALATALANPMVITVTEGT